MNKPITTFAQRMKEAMDIRGMIQQDVADLTNVHRANISQYVNGKRVPKSDNLYQLAKALNVSETWLLGYDVPMERETIGTNDLTIVNGEEQILIELFRDADQKTRDMVFRFMTYSKKMREELTNENRQGRKE